jgi:hypothetical protein
MHDLPLFGVEVRQQEGAYACRLVIGEERIPILDFLYSIHRHVVENAQTAFSLM